MAEPRTTQESPTTHSERLTVSLGLWALAIIFALTLVVAVGLYLTPWYGLGMAGICALVLGVLLGGWGSPRVVADGQGLRAGRQFVEWPWVAGVEALDAAALRRELGPGAKATAFLFTRPYIAGAVKVVLDDPVDPHPYWIVSTRHPARLADAASSQLAANRHPGVGPGA